jgi:hypothetical protein
LWQPVISTPVGVIIGGGLSIATSWLSDWRKQRLDRARARAIAWAYVQGVLSMEEHRQHGELLHQPVLEHLKAGTPVTMPPIFGAENYPATNERQKAVIRQLSHLDPDDAKDFVLFLNMGDGLDADDTAMSTGKMDSLTREQKIDILEGDLKLRKEMLSPGRKLVQRLGGNLR